MDLCIFFHSFGFSLFVYFVLKVRLRSGGGASEWKRTTLHSLKKVKPPRAQAHTHTLTKKKKKKLTHVRHPFLRRCQLPA